MSMPASRPQRVLVELPTLHDDGQMRALLGEKRDVLERVAVDDEKIGEGARRDDSELPFSLQQPRIDQRRGADDLGRRERFGADQELARLIDLQLPQEIAAEADLDSRRLADLERAQARLEHADVLLAADLRQAELVAAPLHR